MPLLICMQAEIWLPVIQPIDCSGIYEVSNMGRIKRLGRVAKIKGHFIPDKIITGSPNDKGYVKVGLSKDGHEIQMALHRLVALHFIPNPNNLPEVNHLDFNKLNNAYSNLEWTTGQGNMDHYYGSGQVKRGTPIYKLTKDDIIYIRQNFWLEGLDNLAEKFKTHRNYIYSIGTGRKRNDVEFKVHHRNIGTKKIILDLNTGIFYESPQELADLLGIKKKYLCRTLAEERKPNTTQYRYV